MLVYDNGKVCVLCATRCGHTSMHYHFGIEPYVTSDIRDWIKSKSQRVLVLRNPYDRFVSALSNTEKIIEMMPDMSEEPYLWTKNHSQPYLHRISPSIDFKIIDFNRLSEYIAVSNKTVITNSKANVIKNKKDFIEFRHEYNRYQYFMKFCKEITPEEWKLLTNGDDSDILVE